MSELTKISMNLTDRDIRNTEAVRRMLHVRTNADAVSAALGITKSLADLVKEGGEVLIKNKNGEVQRLFIPGLNND